MLSKPQIGDLRSGFLVFLIALPLCLSISAASGCPPVAGLITAIAGGLVTGFVGGSRLTIKGPAAGLIVIVLAAVQELGAGDNLLGYKRLLAVAFVAALLQIIASFFKAGSLGQLVPPSVVHGMLAAIGIIIMAKQIHVMLGVVPHSKTPLALIAEIPQSLQTANPKIAFIGLLSLATLFFLPLWKNSFVQRLPAALVALVVVVPLGLIWHMDEGSTYTILGQSYELGPKFLVKVPSNFFSAITFPDFSILSETVAWKHVILLFLISSIESLLTVSAVDSLDPKKQISNLDGDLFASGVGNLLSSFFGGLPMISEIVRSKANIDNGAQTFWANTIHGSFLLIALAFCANLIHEIPLSALAAMLIITGTRLASYKEFLKTYALGLDQLIFFSTTCFLTVGVDLLVGVIGGIVLKFLFHLYRKVSLSQLFSLQIEEETKNTEATLRVKSPAVFSNYMALHQAIDHHLKKDHHVQVDFSQAAVVDHTILEHLHTSQHIAGEDKLQIIGLQKHRSLSEHPLSVKLLA